MSQPILSIRNPTVDLPLGGDRPHVFERLTLDIQPTEGVCILGEAGLGKSITAFPTMGLPPAALMPSSGNALFEGQTVLKLAPSAHARLRGRRTAMIWRKPMSALNPSYTVGAQIEEMFEQRTTLARAERRARALKLLEEVHLPDPERIHGSYPHQLSGGQRQRIVIAMALDPALLTADDPRTALELSTQAQILKLFRELREHHSAGIMFVTPDFDVVAEIADRHCQPAACNPGGSALSGSFSRSQITAKPGVAATTGGAVAARHVLAAEVGAEMLAAGGDAVDAVVAVSFSIVDRQGNMVAMTQTLLSLFGSKVVSPSTGMLMNNGIMWFDPEPGHAEFAGAGQALPDERLPGGGRGRRMRATGALPSAPAAGARSCRRWARSPRISSSRGWTCNRRSRRRASTSRAARMAVADERLIGPVTEALAARHADRHRQAPALSLSPSPAPPE